MRLVCDLTVLRERCSSAAICRFVRSVGRISRTRSSAWDGRDPKRGFVELCRAAGPVSAVAVTTGVRRSLATSRRGVVGSCGVSDVTSQSAWRRRVRVAASGTDVRGVRDLVGLGVLCQLFDHRVQRAPGPRQFDPETLEGVMHLPAGRQRRRVDGRGYERGGRDAHGPIGNPGRRTTRACRLTAHRKLVVKDRNVMP